MTDQVIRDLRGFPEIQALHTTNGGWELVAELGAESLSAFDQLLGRICSMEGAVNSETTCSALFCDDLGTADAASTLPRKMRRVESKQGTVAVQAIMLHKRCWGPLASYRQQFHTTRNTGGALFYLPRKHE
ncbi:Lrp/AsnC ligand binding domain-containing protein (plasmid) [Arthrobacter sp. UC242_113]|uniref:Lrp/AsnC ligand binding domain-containing protein n=1 Tax=Arthrobacter sp. UC242_113 TaxID=3374550 RepID=UPI003756679E